jgi:hypothetical protein
VLNSNHNNPSELTKFMNRAQLKEELQKNTSKSRSLMMHTRYKNEARHRWFSSVILATWGAEIGRIVVPGQLGQKSLEDSISQKKPECGGTELWQEG